MRLSNVLSKPPKSEYVPIESFLTGKKGNIGQKVEIEVGDIALNYYCEKCEDMRTFCSQGKLNCIFVNKNLISIDCVLSCSCGTTAESWFLIESENDITDINPKVRIIKRSDKLSDCVKSRDKRFGEFDELLSKAEVAYREELGAGAIVYLRKIFEKITLQTANAVGIETKGSNGRNINFKELLKRVDSQCHIIPVEYSKNGYKLFGELSNIIHGDFDEMLGLSKFNPLYRLVIGILENVERKKELMSAMDALGWDIAEEETNDQT